MTTTVPPTQAATAVSTWLTGFSDALASNDTFVPVDATVNDAVGSWLFVTVTLPFIPNDAWN